MKRRSSTSIVANPVLVGAVTTLVVVVAVFLSYNANNGLPFVPSRQLNVLLPNGSEVVKGNDVRIGGYRVGVVKAEVPVMQHGHVIAKLELRLDKTVGPIPIDSKIVVRERSALGLKYVELDRGRSTKTLPDGATWRSARARCRWTSIRSTTCSTAGPVRGRRRTWWGSVTRSPVGGWR